MAQPPTPRQIGSGQAAERNARDWMRSWGFTDAHLWQPGSATDIDIYSDYALARVTFEPTPVGRQALHRLHDARGPDDHKLLFFSSAGYSPDGLSYADWTQIALFTYSYTGQMTTANSYAESIQLGVRVARADPPSVADPAPPAASTQPTSEVSGAATTIGHLPKTIATQPKPAGEACSAAELAGADPQWTVVKMPAPGADKESARPAGTTSIGTGTTAAIVLLGMAWLGFSLLGWAWGAVGSAFSSVFGKAERVVVYEPQMTAAGSRWAMEMDTLSCTREQVLQSKVEGWTCTADVRLTNVDDKPRRFHGRDLKLMGEDGKAFPTVDTAGDFGDASFTVDRLIAPGDQVIGRMAWDVKDETAIRKLELNDSFFGRTLTIGLKGSE